MDYGHYNRDTVFGYKEDEEGGITLNIYLGVDYIKEFSIAAKGSLSRTHSKRIWIIRDSEELFDYLKRKESPVNISETEFIMNAGAISKKLTDDNSICRINIITYSHFGYDNNYTRAHDEAEYLLEHMNKMCAQRAESSSEDFEIIVDNIVKNGTGTAAGVLSEPEKIGYEAVYSYYVKDGELKVSVISCTDLDGEYINCPECGCNVDFNEARKQLRSIIDNGLICPGCGNHIGAEKIRRSIENGTYMYKSRDLMPIYIKSDDIRCVSFLKDLSEDRLERLLKLAMEEGSKNCVAAFLQYKEDHFGERDFFSGLMLEDDLFSEENNDSETKAAAQASGAGKHSLIKKEDIENGFITFGIRNNEPIKWRILSRIGNEALIVTEECIDVKNYHTSYAASTWESCGLRKWLNETFINESFSSEEKECIIESEIINSDNLFSCTDGGCKTLDRIFALSIDEADFYFDNSGMRQAKAGKTALSKGVYAAGTGCTTWWLRTPGANSFHGSNVDYFGMINAAGFFVNYTGNPIRPAMWINIG